MNAAQPSDPRAFLSALEYIGIKLGLDQISALLTTLDHPESTFRSIVVAGTNGKGSVVAMVERGLRAAGHRTGRYTSPHLVNLEERFAIDGQDIRPDALDRAGRRVMAASTVLPSPPSFFEATTALALEAFREAGVDVAVLEVGLGGRLDATNIVSPSAVAITSVDFDHEQFLGDTIEAIAGEKAGIIKPGIPVVLSANSPAVENVIASVCASERAMLVRSSESVTSDVTTDAGLVTFSLTTPVRHYPALRLSLPGTHQVQNAITAVRLLEVLDQNRGLRVPEHAIRIAVEQAVWPARLERTRLNGIDVLIDGAHNPAAARALGNYVLETFRRRLPMVIGVMRDKDIHAILAALAPSAERFVFTAANSPRAATPAELLMAAKTVAAGTSSIVCNDPAEAVTLASQGGSPVVVAGSLYLAGEIRAGVT